MMLARRPAFIAIPLGRDRDQHRVDRNKSRPANAGQARQMTIVPVWLVLADTQNPAYSLAA